MTDGMPVGHRDDHTCTPLLLALRCATPFPEALAPWFCSSVSAAWPLCLPEPHGFHVPNGDMRAGLSFLWAEAT
ncbi:hypothetical protein EYF80_030847 [Liparis tanakae]|uniref:Uncharacterized protein n=1 Tax=Liparis tanakae TaxID=230148 RepID=A0A4Z2H287_9TELE|nr:hypothetical protein EYF80_030847 [Liparis tanakae]